MSPIATTTAPVEEELEHEEEDVENLETQPEVLDAPGAHHQGDQRAHLAKNAIENTQNTEKIDAPRRSPHYRRVESILEGKHAGLPMTAEEEKKEKSMTPAEKFDKQFSSTFQNGELGLTPRVGTVLILKDDISSHPGGGYSRAKIRICNPTDANFISFETIEHTEKTTTHVKELSIPKTPELIEALKEKGKNEVYTFSGWNSKSQFIEYMKNKTDLQTRKNVDAEGNKQFLDPESGEKKNGKVTYVGKIKPQIASESTENNIYKVDRSASWVTISTSRKEGKKTIPRENKMSYDTFLVFCKDKGLLPLTDEEANRNLRKTDPETIDHKKGSWMDRLVSISALASIIKSIPEKFKQRYEDKAELQKELASERIGSILSKTGIPGISDVGEGMTGGRDGFAYKRVMKYKNAISGGKEGSDTHDVAISEHIRDEIFGHIESGREYRLKAAGYLMYALEKGNAYFRKLAPFVNKDGGGYWIKVLFGKDAHEKFKQDRKNMIQHYKDTGGIDSELNNTIVKYELEFIHKSMGGKRGESFRGTKLSREIEGYKDNLYGGAGKIDPSSFKGKSFAEKYDSFLGGGIKGFSHAVTFNALKSMEENVGGDQGNYKTFYKSILMMFASGFVHSLPEDYNDVLSGIGRSKGIPIALLAGDANAAKKVIKILDHISINAGKQTFSSTIPGIDIENISISTFSELDKDGKTQMARIADAFNTRRDSNANIVIGAFNYNNDYLIKNIDETKETGRYISGYLGSEGVLNEYEDIRNDNKGVDGQSAFFRNGLINLSSGTFKSYLLGRGDSGMSHEHKRTMWMNFTAMLKEFDASIDNLESENTKIKMIQLLYKKFSKFFATYLDDDTVKRKLREMILSKDPGQSDELAKNLVLEMIGDDRSVKETSTIKGMHVFAQVIAKHAVSLSDDEKHKLIGLSG